MLPHYNDYNIQIIWLPNNNNKLNNMFIKVIIFLLKNVKHVFVFKLNKEHSQLYFLKYNTSRPKGYNTILSIEDMKYFFD